MFDPKDITILIVDDNPENIKVLFFLLQESGFRLSIARSGASALAKIPEINPDLILLDVVMPGLSGFETCRHIKANPKTENIPVIFLSALDEAIDKVKAFEVGGIDYITKPFQAEEVLARINNQLELQVARNYVLQLNLDLEQRVQKRTAQLEQANLELGREIDQRRQIEYALLKSEEQFRLTFERAPIGMAIINLEGKIIRFNQALSQMLEYSNHELLNHSWLDLTHYDDRLAFLDLSIKIYQRDIDDFQIEHRYITRTSNVIYCILKMLMVCDDDNQPLHLVAQLVDITDRKHIEQQLMFNAFHDHLTQLPNRNLLMERLGHALSRAKRNPAYLFALLFIDLDRFKNINDSLGHYTGDQLLIMIANRLQSLVRESDTVARLGGDEFVILLDSIPEINDALRIAERLSRELSSPFQLGGRQVFTTASIGIVLSSAHYHQESEILRDADIAMYRAKANGGACYQIFDQVMHAYAIKKLNLENDLHQAILRHEFTIHYQPIVSLETGSLSGFEALLRWHHPIRELVLPNDFIAVAEETGLIIPIGVWVLQTACEQLATWLAKYSIPEVFTLSVNLSAKQLKHPGFLEQVLRILDNTGVNPYRLKLELTESMLLDDIDNLIYILSMLRERGIQLSIDDFGTGYSCLSYLHRFPVNTLKIDRSFIERIGDDGQNAQIVDTIITLAHQLDMTSTAEGVETIHDIRHLKALGCEEAQGYFFAPPLDCQSAEKLIAESAKNHWLDLSKQ